MLDMLSLKLTPLERACIETVLPHLGSDGVTVGEDGELTDARGHALDWSDAAPSAVDLQQSDRLAVDEDGRRIVAIVNAVLAANMLHAKIHGTGTRLRAHVIDQLTQRVGAEPVEALVKRVEQHFRVISQSERRVFAARQRAYDLGAKSSDFLVR